MKICTDSCILGAYTQVNPNEKVLDIGTGTGLLALMLAQRGTVSVDAVEVDREAAKQAAENVFRGPFKEQIKVYCTPIQAFVKTKFDLIVSNPPFYFGQLPSGDKRKDQARHGTELQVGELAAIIHEKLKPKGRAAILLPDREMDAFVHTMNGMGFELNDDLHVAHSPEKPVFRRICCFSREKKPIKEKRLDIYGSDNKTYSREFRFLLEPYYIIF